MAVTDIASRTYNHGWQLDPVVRSLLDTDFYKLLMQRMSQEFYPDRRRSFSVINRSKHVRLAEIIDEGELRAQLDHARSIRFTKEGADLARRQHVLRQDPDVLAGVHQLALDLPPARI